MTKQRLGEFLQERLFAPLGMVDTQFVVPASKAARIARPLPLDPETGKPPTFRVPVKPWQYDCGGGCASGTAIDYMRFALMLLNKGTLDGTRILSRKTVEYMTADQLGADVDVERLHEFAVEHIDGFGFGLGVAVRRQAGIAGVPGTPGEFLWSGAQGTMFWVDPKEELAVVFLANTPGPIRRHYRETGQDARGAGDRRLTIAGVSRRHRRHPPHRHHRRRSPRRPFRPPSSSTWTRR